MKMMMAVMRTMPQCPPSSRPSLRPWVQQIGPGVRQIRQLKVTPLYNISSYLDSLFQAFRQWTTASENKAGKLRETISLPYFSHQFSRRSLFPPFPTVRTPGAGYYLKEREENTSARKLSFTVHWLMTFVFKIYPERSLAECSSSLWCFRPHSTLPQNVLRVCAGYQSPGSNYIFPLSDSSDSKL